MTIVWCVSMSAMGAMDMPGGWAMSMMWMRMPGQSWLGVSGGFVGDVGRDDGGDDAAVHWPRRCWRYHESLGATVASRRGWLTALVGVGYFAVWAVLGVVVFALGSVLAAIAMEKTALARAVPMVVGAAVLIAGVLQHTGWKARQLALCREAPGHGQPLAVRTGAAWRHGWCLGLHCVQSCAGLTAVVLALGVMDLRVMAVVAGAITVERLAPNSVRMARAIGVAVVALGLVMVARTAGFG